MLVPASAQRHFVNSRADGVRCIKAAKTLPNGTQSGYAARLPLAMLAIERKLKNKLIFKKNCVSGLHAISRFSLHRNLKSPLVFQQTYCKRFMLIFNVLK